MCLYMSVRASRPFNALLVVDVVEVGTKVEEKKFFSRGTVAGKRVECSC